MYATQSWLYPDTYLISPFHVCSVENEWQHHKSKVYLVRTEWVSVPNDNPVIQKNWYSIYSGVFIGDETTARMIVRQRKWRMTDLQPAHPSHAFCNVAWSRDQNKIGWAGFNNPCPTAKYKRIFTIGDLHYPETYKAGTITELQEAKESAIRYAIDINSIIPSELPEATDPLPIIFTPPTPPTLTKETIDAIHARNETEGRQL